jgi:hypothetical protein
MIITSICLICTQVGLKHRVEFFWLFDEGYMACILNDHFLVAASSGGVFLQ